VNLSDMRTNVRRDLRDEDSENYRWTNDELERHITRAVSEFSEAVPLEQKAQLLTTLGSMDIDISSLSDRIMVKALEYPIDAWPRSYQRFSLWEDTLTLLGDYVPDGSDCYIYYGKLHTLDVSSSTIPTKHEDLVALGAEGYALVAWAAFAINQVSLGGTGTPTLFRIEGQQKLRQFRKELKRLGRLGKARVARLYTPATSIVSMSSDPGP